MRSSPSTTYRSTIQARADRSGATMSLIAFLGAFALIAAITLGMPSVHPF